MKRGIFLKKLWKIYLGGYIPLLTGRGYLATKINITFFRRKWGFKYFSIYNFWKRTILSKIFAKNYFRGYDNYWGNGVSDNKNECNLFCVKWFTQYLLFSNFFLKKTTYRMNERIFPLSVVPFGWLSPKIIGFTHRWTSPTMWISWKSVQNWDHLHRAFLYIQNTGVGKSHATLSQNRHARILFILLCAELCWLANVT